MSTGVTDSGNRALIAGAFDAWAKGEGTVFDLLADDVVWTITGTSPLAGTYRGRREFLATVIAPLSARLAEPIVPTVEAVYADGDTVVVVWSGHAVAHDGEAYDNRYCWIMRVESGKLAEVTAFFDAPMLADLWARVTPPVQPEG
jgi:uncharacterized protein